MKTELTLNPARLKNVLKNSELSQAELAAKTGLSPATISRITKGSKVPDINEVERIAEAIGMGVEELLGKKGAKDFADSWISADLAKKLEEKLAAVTQELAAARSELAAKDAMIENLSNAAERSREKTLACENQLAECYSQLAGKQVQCDTLQSQVEAATKQANDNYNAWLHSQDLVKRMKQAILQGQKNLTTAQRSRIDAGIVGGILGLAAGALLSSGRGPKKA